MTRSICSSRLEDWRVVVVLSRSKYVFMEGENLTISGRSVEGPTA